MAINSPYRAISELPTVIPVFPLPGILLLPHAQLPLNIYEPRYMAMIDETIRSERIIGMIQPSDSGSNLRGKPTLQPVGCAGRITQFAESGDGRYLLSLTGCARFRVLEELETLTSYRQCKVDYGEFSTDLVDANDEEFDRKIVVDSIREFSRVKNMRIEWRDIDKASNAMLINAMAMMGPFGSAEKQALLEAPDIKTRAETLVAIIELEMAKTDNVSNKLQ
jgi:uncharacterized protein